MSMYSHIYTDILLYRVLYTKPSKHIYWPFKEFPKVLLLIIFSLHTDYGSLWKMSVCRDRLSWSSKALKPFIC